MTIHVRNGRAIWSVQRTRIEDFSNRSQLYNHFAKCHIYVITIKWIKCKTVSHRGHKKFTAKFWINISNSGVKRMQSHARKLFRLRMFRHFFVIRKLIRKELVERQRSNNNLSVHISIVTIQCRRHTDDYILHSSIPVSRSQLITKLHTSTTTTTKIREHCITVACSMSLEMTFSQTGWMTKQNTTTFICISHYNLYIHVYLVFGFSIHSIQN